MKKKRITSTDFSQEERNTWKNLEVNLDSFSNRWEERYSEDFKKELQKLPTSFLKNVLKHFSISFNATDDVRIKLIENRRASILLYCVIDFALKNPKVICEVFSIPIKKKIDSNIVIETIFTQYQTNRLDDLFIFLLRRQLGKGRYQYSFSEPIKQTDFDSIVKFMPNLASMLKRKEKNNKIYDFRFCYKSSKGEWLFLLLKETNDKVHLAIPNNISMVKGTYKLVTVKPAENTIEVSTTSREEALHIRNYFNKKLKNSYTFRREERDYQPQDFFKKVLVTSDDDALRLVAVKFKENNLAVNLNISDPHLKNDIIAQLKLLQKQKILKLKDFSEFTLMNFKYKGMIIPIQVNETTWGVHRLNLVDRRVSHADVSSFKVDFERRFGVELDKWLKRADVQLNKSVVIGKILDKKVVPVRDITKDVEASLFELMNDNILSKVQRQSIRICENTACRTRTWDKEMCPRCGRELRIDGDFVEIKTNSKGIYNFVYKAITAVQDLKATRDKIQIARRKHDVIEVMNKAGEVLTVYIAQTNVPEEIINHYHSNGLPLLVILTHYKDAINMSVTEKNFECAGIVDLYVNADDPSKVASLFKRAINRQKLRWKEKLLGKGFTSYNSALTKSANYTAQNFETDTFNMLHELFYVAYKLGGTFTGVKAPDGVISVRNYAKPLKKYCMSWDCKYSTQRKGYSLNDSPKKHRHYIKVLDSNPRVKFFGGLKVHAIISQNMNLTNYEKFYKKLVSRFTWNGEVVFIQESQLLQLYKFYRENSQAILAKPHIFYTALQRLLLRIHKKDQIPFPHLTDNRMDSFYDEVQTEYKKQHINLEFTRKDFD